MNRLQTLTVLLILLLLLLAGSALAQRSPQFDLGWSVLSSGGGARSSSQYQLEDVLGQWPAGLSGSPRYHVVPGFWPAGTAAEPSRLYLPSIFNPAVRAP